MSSFQIGDVRTDQEYTNATRQKPQRSDMAKHADTQSKMIEAGRALVKFDQNVRDRIEMGDEPNHVAIQRERAKIIAHIRALDDQMMSEFREHLAARDAEAKRLRLRADNESSPTKRLADIEEMKMLVASNVDGGEFVRRAYEMLDAGLADRAVLFMNVAEAKGAAKSATHELRAYLDAALDETNEGRKTARDIEHGLDAENDSFLSERARILAVTVGMRIDGTAGTDEPGQRAVANVSRKVGDYEAAVAAGAPYSAPVGDGSNTPRDEVDMHRSVNTRMINQDKFEGRTEPADGEE